MLAVTHPHIWWQRRDLNPHRPAYEAGALPLSYAAVSPELVKLRCI